MLQEVKIDAANQILGRLATGIAFLLRGKDLPSFAPNQLPHRRVVVTNADKIRVSGNKAEQKRYRHHSGYPGGLKELSFQQVFAKNPGKVLEKAVYGMLPKNKLRAKMMQQLIIQHGTK